MTIDLTIQRPIWKKQRRLSVVFEITHMRSPRRRPCFTVAFKSLLSVTATMHDTQEPSSPPILSVQRHCEISDEDVQFWHRKYAKNQNYTPLWTHLECPMHNLTLRVACSVQWGQSRIVVVVPKKKLLVNRGTPRGESGAVAWERS